MANTGDNSFAIDPFDSILNLEDQYHQEGYLLGVRDGAESGRTEGRTFGLEKGFEKFLELGRLQGMTEVWEARLPPKQERRSGDRDETQTSLAGGARQAPALRQLSGSDKLRRHIERLSALTELETIPTDNSEEGVTELDDRLRDAKAKATLIEKVIGEDGRSVSLRSDNTTDVEAGAAGESGRPRNVRVKRAEVQGGDAAKGGDVEDFVMPRHLRS